MPLEPMRVTTAVGRLQKALHAAALVGLPCTPAVQPPLPGTAAAGFGAETWACGRKHEQGAKQSPTHIRLYAWLMASKHASPICPQGPPTYIHTYTHAARAPCCSSTHLAGSTPLPRTRCSSHIGTSESSSCCEAEASSSRVRTACGGTHAAVGWGELSSNQTAQVQSTTYCQGGCDSG